MMTFNELKDYVNTQLFSPLNVKPQYIILDSLLKEVENILDANDIEAIYPKNLFQIDKHIEMYTFDNTEHLFKTAIENGKIASNILSLKNVTQMSNIIDPQNQARILILKFADGEIIELNITQDTDMRNIQRFSALILKICKLILSNRK